MSQTGAGQSRERTNGVPHFRAPRAAWWLPGPHLPTLFGKLARRVPWPRTTRVRLATQDGDTIAIERVDGRHDLPRIIVFHGLEGGTHSTYARGVLREAERRGWSADLVLWRTCDGEPVNAVARSYHSGASDDAGFVIEQLLAEKRAGPTFLLGVSLGANVLLKWLGEQGARVPASIGAAVAVSTPFDLGAAARKIERGFSRVYGRFFLRSLRAKTAAKLGRFPALVDAQALAAARTLREFDELVTAPVHGYKGADDYYERASSLQFLESIRVPTLLLNARNDPFLPRAVLDRVAAAAARNPFLHCAFPAGGGHVGFISGNTPFAPEYWMEVACLDWMREAAELRASIRA
ncbi:MAG TPA: alpha/beta fold hydrolase [Gemmatimonadaceae bacterium]|nr:alpha/beta fold hydrolase [Gemmatimonadaceae bacterium]